MISYRLAAAITPLGVFCHLVCMVSGVVSGVGRWHTGGHEVSVSIQQSDEILGEKWLQACTL